MDGATRQALRAAVDAAVRVKQPYAKVERAERRLDEEARAWFVLHGKATDKRPS